MNYSARSSTERISLTTQMRKEGLENDTLLSTTDHGAISLGYTWVLFVKAFVRVKTLMKLYFFGFKEGYGS